MRLLIDTGANKNYISPRLVEQKFRRKIISHQVKNINGIFNINEYVEWNPFEILLKNQILPKQPFYIFQFHTFFDGLIGYETLRNLEAIIDTAENSLLINNQKIQMQKRFPRMTECNFQESFLNKSIRTPIESGDFYIDRDVEISPGIKIPSGIYRAENYQAVFPLVNTDSELRTVSLDLESIPLEIHNFEEIVPPSVLPKIGTQFYEQLRLDHLNQEERSGLMKILHKHESTFYQEGADLSFTNVIKHRIRTADDLPCYTKSYRYPFCHKDEVQRQISKMLEQGIIKPSTSPWASPIWIVPKKEDASGNKKWRLVIDYRKLNLKTIDDRYPIPNITEILDKLGRCQYFTTLDLASGFHQIEVHPDDVQKTAFSVDHGLYEFVRMPFGLKNAPATFQRVMDHVLKDLIGKCCLVYMDDIIIFSASLQEHLVNLSKVLQALEKVNLKIQLDKSEFLRKEVAFLGHIVTDKGVKPNPDKIRVIENWPIPKNQKDLKAFLGLLGYYRRFIRDFAKITKPLTAQLRKGEDVEHTSQFLKTFDICKHLLTSSDVLQYPDMSAPFILTTDASNFAIGAVLSQGTVGKDRPVAYASRTLSKSEENYSAIEKELLAIDWATRHFRPYLFGKKFTLYTDHQPLTFALNLKTPNSKLVKWRLRLSEFNFTPIYKPGKQNVVADALSRIPSEGLELNINEDITDSSDSSSVHSADSDITDLIKCTEQPVNFFSNQIILQIGSEDEDYFNEIFPRVFRRVITRINFGVPLLIKILRDYTNPKRVNCIMCPERVIQSLQIVYRNYFSRHKNFKVVISQKQLADLTSEEEQDVMIEQTHELAHRGIRENYDEIVRRYYFPNMKRKIRRFVILCDICNRNKYERKPYQIKYGETPLPNAPLEIVHTDIFIAQPNIFLSFIDKFSRLGTLIPIKSRSIPHVKKGLIKYFCMHGRPKLLVSDNEPAIKSIEVRGLLNDLHVQQYFTPANHSQSNGMVERFHSTVSEIFRCNQHKFENIPQKEKFLLACMMYNDAIHTSTKLKPREIHIGLKDGEERPLEIEKIIEARDCLYDEVILNMTASQQKQLTWHNKNREDPPPLDPGQSVQNKRQGIRKKTRELFDNVKVATDRHQTYVDDSRRKLHKSNLRRVRK